MGYMESIYSELALFGSKNEFAKTDNVFSLISEVCDDTACLKCLTGRALTTLNNHLKHFIIMNILQGILMNKFEI